MKGLRPDASYEVESADLGILGSSSGRDLMTRGVELQASTISKSHVLVMRAR
jgi:hypothetical protein